MILSATAEKFQAEFRLWLLELNLPDDVSSLVRVHLCRFGCTEGSLDVTYGRYVGADESLVFHKISCTVSSEVMLATSCDGGCS